MAFALRPLAIPFLALGLCLVSGAAHAGAQHKEDEGVKRDVARSYVLEGDAAFEKGDYATALDRFERAERLVPAPTVLLRMGRTQLKLGHWVEAKESLRAAANMELAADAPAPFYKAVVEAQRELTVLEPKIPTLQIVAPGAVTELTLNGRLIPNEIAAKPIDVNPGAYVIALPCCAAQQVNVREGEHLTVRFTPKPKDSDAETSGKPMNGYLIGSLVSFGVGAFGLGLGVYETVQTVGFQDEFANYQVRYAREQNLCNIAAGYENDAPLSGAPLSASERTTIVDICAKADTARILQFVGYPIGLLGVGTGAALLVLALRASTPNAARVQILPVLTATESGVWVRGVF